MNQSHQTQPKAIPFPAFLFPPSYTSISLACHSGPIANSFSAWRNAASVLSAMACASTSFHSGLSSEWWTLQKGSWVMVKIRLVCLFSSCIGSFGTNRKGKPPSWWHSGFFWMKKFSLVGNVTSKLNRKWFTRHSVNENDETTKGDLKKTPILDLLRLQKEKWNHQIRSSSQPNKQIMTSSLSRFIASFQTIYLFLGQSWHFGCFPP